MKKLIAILLCAAMLFSLAACGGKEEEKPAVNPGNNSSGENTPGGSEPSPKPSAGTKDGILELEKKFAGKNEDELTWENNSASKTIVISGEGPMKSYMNLEPEWYQYCDEAVKVVIGEKVSSVGEAAFAWFTALTEVQLGSSVEFIGDYAFCDCWELRQVNFPANLKYVGEDAFCNALLHSDSGFSFPEGMLYIGEEAFYSAFKEGAVTIPASLTKIEDCAFANVYVTEFIVDPANTAYTSVDGVLFDKGVTRLIGYPAQKQEKQYEVPATVAKICEHAMEVNSYLEKLVIPASVREIEERAIFWNYALSSIDVDPNNGSYQSVDGVLFTKDGKDLVCYPLASDRTEYTVPDGTEEIWEYAMSQAANLTELHFPEGFLEIEESGLFFCENLTSVGLPLSLKEIGKRAFQSCYGLQEIRYAGSKEDWARVELEEENDNLSNGSIKIYFAK